MRSHPQSRLASLGLDNIIHTVTTVTLEKIFNFPPGVLANDRDGIRFYAVDRMRALRTKEEACLAGCGIITAPVFKMQPGKENGHR